MKRKRNGHHAVERDRKVRVWWRDGRVTIDRYVETKSRWMRFREAGRVPKKEVAHINYA